jgi:hypothetical protein
LRLPNIFANGMVLQQGKPVTVWGWAKAAAVVTVEYAGQAKSATAGADSKWTVQSSENGGPHGCSEHIPDKQNRHCRSATIENISARVVIHWRYPCVDVSYKNLKAGQWTDEYHTIHPDGTGVRQVVWNSSNGSYGPAFQAIPSPRHPIPFPPAHRDQDRILPAPP